MVLRGYTPHYQDVPQEVLFEKFYKLLTKFYPDNKAQELAHQHVAAHYKFIRLTLYKVSQTNESAVPVAVSLYPGGRTRRQSKNQEPPATHTFSPDAVMQEIVDLLESVQRPLEQSSIHLSLTGMRLTRAEFLAGMHKGINEGLIAVKQKGQKAPIYSLTAWEEPKEG